MTLRELASQWVPGHRKEGRPTGLRDGRGADTCAKWWTCEQSANWVAEWSHGSLGRHTKRVPKMARKKVALQVMRDLAEWSERPPVSVRQQYPDAKFGLAGIQAYAPAIETKPQQHMDSAWHGCHAVNLQWTGRNSTANYLSGLASTDTLAPEANEHLLAAAKEYGAAFATWQEFY